MPHGQVFLKLKILAGVSLLAAGSCTLLAGDFVWLIFEHQAKDPRDSSKTHHFDSFEIIRIQNGKVQEHWDSEKKRPGTPVFVPSTAPAPSKWPAGQLSKEERRNLKLATDA